MAEIIDQLWHLTLKALAARRFPLSTYRLQFHSGFTFQDAARLTPYLARLGITDCYASPYLKARPGSMHGYDITDHRLLNPEIGTEEDYAGWLSDLRPHGLGQILDIVPNHMAVVGNENIWWNDVLENGPSSAYAEFFDIAWTASLRPEMQGRILIPILGDPYGKVLERGELRLTYDAGALAIYYFEHRFPVSPDSYGSILGHRLDELQRLLGAESPALLEYESILTAIKHLPGHGETDPTRVAERHREKEVIKRRLGHLTTENPAVSNFVEQNVALFNGRPGDLHSFDLLEQLLDRQAYRLAYWRVAADEINYRRFFDVNELAALSMEREDVFRATHERIFHLLADNAVLGLRIDHPDGLYDPREYLDRLQRQFLLSCARSVYDLEPSLQTAEWQSLGPALLQRIATYLSEPRGAAHGCPPLYVAVEKILTGDEQLPDNWQTCGTTGYDFLNLVNALFVDNANAKAFTTLYREWIGDDTRIPEIFYRSKLLILHIALSSELHMLAHQLDRLAQKNRWLRDFTSNSLRNALREVVACFPVYRSYIAGTEISEADRKYVLRAIRRANTRNPAIAGALFNFIGDVLLNRSHDTAPPNGTYEQERQRFVGKFQQVTAPVMAKGIEDTAFYIYNRLLSLNEVGGDPTTFGRPVAEVHAALEQRQQRWPYALSASSTHDTKRSEDVRARLNVLSELPGEWRAAVARWSRLNEHHRITDDEGTVPDPNEEYFLYQTLVGAWPIEPCDAEEYQQFIQRIQAYIAKASHEAKVHTSWINPNTVFDDAMQKFIAQILDPSVSGEFLEDFRQFQLRVSHYGMFNSLSQTVVKIGAPGVADFYQGSELWDLSLVDPDNRRPVDYDRREELLRQLDEQIKNTGHDRSILNRELVAHAGDGRIKLYVTVTGLRVRREHPDLFTTGNYTPVEVQGDQSEHVFAFMRHTSSACVVVAVPRLVTRLVEVGQAPCGKALWQNTVLRLPNAVTAKRWRNCFTGEIVCAGECGVNAGQIFEKFPVAMLIREPRTK